jgi:hypothetical protein
MPHNLTSLPETAGLFNRIRKVPSNEHPAGEAYPAG